MKRLLYWLYLLVKRQLKNPVIVVVLIAMPVAALIVTNTALDPLIWNLYLEGIVSGK